MSYIQVDNWTVDLWATNVLYNWMIWDWTQVQLDWNFPENQCYSIESSFWLVWILEIRVQYRIYNTAIKKEGFTTLATLNNSCHFKIFLEVKMSHGFYSFIKPNEIMSIFTLISWIFFWIYIFLIMLNIESLH